jgi:hypothetical protein
MVGAPIVLGRPPRFDDDKLFYPFSVSIPPKPSLDLAIIGMGRPILQLELLNS